MNDVMKTIKKTFTTAVAVATIAWSVSLSAFLAPLVAQAAAPAPGSLVRASLPAVYYVGTDGKRYVFPNEKTYKTWYPDFSGVMTITDAELASLPIGGNVTYKPGAALVKITTDPKVYAVDAHGMLRWVKTEALAVALYGATWNTMLTHDVPDAFFTNYAVGGDINNASDYNPATVRAAAVSINVDKNLGTGGVIGSVSVSLSSGQPAGGTVPHGATGVNVLKFDVKNSGSTAVTLSSLTVHRFGAGTASDFDQLYVYQGASRLTTGRTINTSSNDAVFSGLNSTIAPGATQSYWIAADWDGGTGNSNVNAFTLTNVMVGGNSATGTPVSGPSFTTASATVGTVTLEGTGTLSHVKAGGMKQKVAGFRLGAPSNEDMDFQSISLMLSGTANRSEVTNLSLTQAGLTLATAPTISDKDLAVFSLSSPMFLERGATRTFEVWADVSGAADANDTIVLDLDQNSDLHAVGRTYGYGLKVLDTMVGQSVVIDAGKLTTTFNGPAAHDVAVNGKDVELFNFTVAAQSNLEIRQTNLRVVTTGHNVSAIIRDLKLVDVATGAVLAGPQDANGFQCDGGTVATLSEDFCFTETWNLDAGQTKTLKVTADIPNTATLDGDTIKVTLGVPDAVPNALLFPKDKVRNIDGSAFLLSSDMVPNVPISGNTHTVNSNSLDISSASSPVAQTYIQGTQGAALAGFALKSGDAGSVKVNSLVLTGTSTGSVNNTVLSAKLWNGTTQIGETESPTGAGVLTFDNLNLTIPAGQTVNIKLSGDLAGSIATVPDDMFFTLSSTSVDATNADGDTVAVGGGAVAGKTMTISGSGTVSVLLAADDTDSEASLVVGGTMGATLAKFRFTAQNEDLRLTKARIKIASASSSGVSNLWLYDGATLVGGPVAVSGSGIADFSSVTFNIMKDTSKTLTVKGDLNSVGPSGAPTGTNVSVMLDWNDNFEVRGTSAGSSTQITSFGTGIAAVPAVPATFGTGTYSLADAACVLGETYSATIFGNLVTYTAAGLDCAGADGADSDAILTGLSAAINSDLATGPTVNATPNLATNQISLVADVAGVAGNYSTAAADSSVAGTLVAGQAAMTGGTAGTPAVPAVPGADLAGRDKILRKTKPTVTLVGGTTTILTGGTITALRFKVAADASSDIALHALHFDITSVGAFAATTGSSVRRMNVGTNIAGTAVAAGGGLDVVFTDEEIISAGTDQTYDLRLTTTLTGATDSISASLAGDVLPVVSGTAAAIDAAASSNFVWSDESTIPHSITSADWTNGLYVKFLPTDTFTMTE